MADIKKTSTAKAAPTPQRVIRLEAITIEGRIQKPQAFYILQRSKLADDIANMRESFIPKIFESVEKKPF